MECKFVVGQKVVCLFKFKDDLLISVPIKNKIYTIREIFAGTGEQKNLTGLKFKEIVNPISYYEDFGFGEASFVSYHFKPLSEIRKEKFKQMINNIPSSFYNEVVKESELV